MVVVLEDITLLVLLMHFLEALEAQDFLQAVVVQVVLQVVDKALAQQAVVVLDI